MIEAGGRNAGSIIVLRDGREVFDPDSQDKTAIISFQKVFIGLVGSIRVSVFLPQLRHERK